MYSRTRTRIYTTLQENRFSFIFEIGVALSAAVGVLFIVVFFGMRLNLFTVAGSIEQRNEFFTDTSGSGSGKLGSSATSGDGSASGISEKDQSLKLVSEMQFAFRDQLKTVRKQIFPDVTFAWADSDEWKTLSQALTKDKETIRKAASDAGISPRFLVSIVIAEQLRFFTSDRESFKKFFEPLKILGSMSQFSLGVSGVKEETALAIEQHLKDTTSPYYIGPEFKNMLDPKPSEYDSEAESLSAVLGDKDKMSQIRFTRITDAKDHYYSYLYTALFARQIIEQWKKAGYDLSYRPEIVATLFNLGFDKSVPKENPQVAGADVAVGGETYTFGRLAYEFYYSGELIEIFGF